MSEVEALMSLTHPNIVRLYEYYRGTDKLILVEEYRAARSRSGLAEQGGKLRADEAALVLRQMLRGVLCCHAHGLSHRDLKPDNWVWQSRDRTAALKLIDFARRRRGEGDPECRRAREHGGTAGAHGARDVPAARRRRRLRAHRVRRERRPVVGGRDLLPATHRRAARRL